MRAIGAPEQRDLDTINARVETGRRFGLGADRVDAGIGAAAFRHFHNGVVDIYFQEIEGLGSGAARKRPRPKIGPAPLLASATASFA
jgi:hypothetical protein